MWKTHLWTADRRILWIWFLSSLQLLLLTLLNNVKTYVPINPLTAEWALRALIDFTLSNARWFYSPMGNPLDGKGLSSTESLKKSRLDPVQAWIFSGFCYCLSSINDNLTIIPLNNAKMAVRNYFCYLILKRARFTTFHSLNPLCFSRHLVPWSSASMHSMFLSMSERGKHGVQF